jgi:pilus assembly protein CpaF
MGSRLSRLNRGGQQDRQPEQQTQPVAPAPVAEQSRFAQDVSAPPNKKRTSPRVAQLRKQLRPKLLSAPNELDEMDSENPEHQQIVRDRLRVVLERAQIQISPQELAELEIALIYDLLGFGAIEPLVRNKGYSEIMVNGSDIIFAEYKGKLLETEYVFDDDEHIQWTAQRIVRPLQREFNRQHPMVDARLPDGSRVHLIMPPSALEGTTITIRKFPESRLTVQNLIDWGSITEEVAEFLQACVVARLNIVVSGGTASGKTTLLNVLSSFIPEDERIVTIEDSAELPARARHE